MKQATVPKVELHCHLDGIVDPAMLRQLRQRGNDLPLTPEALEQAYPVATLDDFIRWFDAIDPLGGDLALFQPIIARHIERLKAQNVVYAEIMISSGELSWDRVQMVEQVTEFREWVTRHEAGAIQVEFLVAFGRQKAPEQVAANAARLIPLYEAGLIGGIALAGLEPGHPVKPFASTFARLHETGMGIEVHAGEWAGPESVWDALKYGYPDRIGHGTHLFEDERLVNLVQDRNIHIEMCPTSNLKTGSITRIEDHPIGEARDLGLNFSVNTDDPGAFECSMASEHQLLADVFGFSSRDFEQLYANSLAARFQPTLRIGSADEG